MIGCGAPHHSAAEIVALHYPMPTYWTIELSPIAQFKKLLTVSQGVNTSGSKDRSDLRESVSVP